MRPFIKHPFFAFTILFVNLLLCFLWAYCNPLTIKWVIFVGIVGLTLSQMNIFKKLRSSCLIHVGKRTSEIMKFMISAAMIVGVISTFALATDQFTHFDLTAERINKIPFLFFITLMLIGFLFIPEIAIFQQGIMARGKLFRWDKIDCVRTTREGCVVLKTTFCGLFPTEIILRTDQETCKILEDVLEQHGYEGSESYLSIKPEASRLP